MRLIAVCIVMCLCVVLVRVVMVIGGSDDVMTDQIAGRGLFACIVDLLVRVNVTLHVFGWRHNTSLAAPQPLNCLIVQIAVWREIGQKL